MMHESLFYQFFSFIFSNTIVAFIILISLVVFVHEFGHFIAGKIFKIQVEEFSIGFGPVAYSFKKGPTEYRINWLPLGGYVRFYGADIEENISLENQQKSLLHAKLYQRAIVSFAGPFANFVLSFIVMIILVCHGLPAQSSFVSVVPHSVAASSGIQTGDKIISINENKINTWSDLSKNISSSAQKKLHILLLRENKEISLDIIPKSEEGETLYGTKEKSGKIGVTPYTSSPFIVPNKNDFFHEIGLQQGDEIKSISLVSPKNETIKINYFYEIFNAMEKFTQSNSDTQLAHKIISHNLSQTKINLSFVRENKTNILSLPFHSLKLTQWAQKIINEKSTLPWSDITASSDLTFHHFFSTTQKINLTSLKAWESCGLKKGFTIRGINDEKGWTHITQLMQFFSSLEQDNSLSKIKSVPLQLNGTDEMGKNKTLSCLIPVTQKVDSLNKQRNIIELPFVFQSEPRIFPSVLIQSHSVTETLQMSFHYLSDQMLIIYKGLKMLFSGAIPLSNLGGPISVASIAGEAAKAGLMTFLLTLSLISVNIGMVNLMPLPALDGGNLFLYFIEAFYGKPLPKSVQIYVQRAGIVILLTLFVFVFYNDILRLIHS